MTDEKTIWTFKTRNFKIVWTIETNYSPDLSWDETGETAEKIASGEWTAFDSKIAVFFRGAEIAADHLGESIYADPAEFRDHIGINIKSREDGRTYGSYFSGMVRNAISEARDKMREIPRLRE